ncbi:MAG: hypothetical protein ACM3WV_01870 [Bacillota bacterium]
MKRLVRFGFLVLLFGCILCHVSAGAAGAGVKTGGLTAVITVNPDYIKPAGTLFTFDASGCKDDKDSPAKLQVRWDWENDGTWDTGFTTVKTATHAYKDEGARIVALQVKDTAGNTAVAYDRVITGWRPFSENSPWNQKIAKGAKIDPHSEELVQTLSYIYINIRKWSIPVYYIDSEATPKYNVGASRPGVVGDGFAEPNQIPIPDGVIPSPPVGGDNHLCIIDKKKNLEWGMWWARKIGGEWTTGLGAVTDLTGTGVRPPVNTTQGFTSHAARASGFPLIAGLIRVEEIKNGRIDHALVFAYQRCRSEYFIPPASTSQCKMNGIDHYVGIPMGGRIQLDPSFDVERSGLSEIGKIIARALQEYGAYCGDYAGATVLYAENSPEAVKEWNKLGLTGETLKEVFNDEAVRKYFRVIDMGKLIVGQNYEEY